MCHTMLQHNQFYSNSKIQDHQPPSLSEAHNTPHRTARGARVAALPDRPLLLPGGASDEFSLSSPYNALADRRSVRCTDISTLHLVLEEGSGLTSTTLVPSLNLARKRTFALVKRPSLRETTMNWLPLNLFRKSWPMCWVCCRSSAASISSRMYIGAGLN